MAEVEASVNTETTNGGAHDFRSLLSGEERDFLVRNNGDQVFDLRGFACSFRVSPEINWKRRNGSLGFVNFYCDFCLVSDLSIFSW